MALTLLLTLVAWCAAVGNWNDFSGAFQMTGLAGGSGYVTGNVVWSWTQSKMLLTFNTGTSATWQETYTFNSTWGYPAQAGRTADPPQYIFTIGSACSPNCNTASTTSGQPLLNPSLTSYLRSSGSGTCLTYTPSVPNSLLSSMTASDSRVCTFRLVDGRVFTMTSFSTASTSITTPSNCQCTQAVDIQFLIDHSGSISDNEMTQFKNFVTNFLKGLTISPTAVNVGMTYFSVPSQVGTNFPMTGELATVNAGMEGWRVPCVQNNPQCQGGGTATPSGLQYAVDALYTSSRKVPKILITLTDGATNTGFNARGCCYDYRQGRDAFVGCNANIDTAVAYVKNKRTQQSYTHTLTLISAGIGNECTSDNRDRCYSECRYTPHLLKFADGNSANVLSVDNWAQLQTQVANLMALTCVTSNNVAQATCLNTCNGLCVCGGCSPPTGCNNNNCFNYTLSGGSCQPSANPCPNRPCFVSSCNQTLNGGQGECVYTPISCASVTSGCNNCVKYTCATSGASAGTCSVPDASGCPAQQDCVQSSWGSWTACTAACGGGKANATRTVVTPAANCGAPCGPALQTFDCNTQPCPTPCVVSDWGTWSACTATCGGGTQTQSRNVTSQPTNGGTACPLLINTTSCNTDPCPVNCSWYPWSEFGPCSVSCGGGNKTQSRTIRVQVANGGVNCTGSDTNTTDCNNNGCPVDCVWGPWSDYSACTLTCGNGTQVRTRNQTVPVANGGVDCTGLAIATQNCNSQQCACNGTWSNYTDCLCESSTRNRTYTILTNGSNCSATNQSVEVSGCTPEGCPVDCVGKWGEWSDCSCGTATQSRTFSITQPALNGGANCTNTSGTEDFQTCNITAAGCPIPCVGAWADWTVCDCNNNNQNRTYNISSPAINNGTSCPGDQIQSCVPSGCPVPCVGYWSEWGFCPCVGYSTSSTQNRTYIVTVPAEFSGTPCDTSAPANRSCTAVFCPVDCVGEWGEWGTCDCANETHTRNFTVTTNQSNGGLFCVANDGATDTQGCTPVGCTNYGPKCTGPNDTTSCVDSSLCTVNQCLLRPDGLYHCDWSLPVNCDDNSTCTFDSCDDLKGCQYQDRVCNDGSACTNDFCDPVNGCGYTNITCKVNASDFCYQPICDSIVGCTTQQRTCPGDIDDDDDNCTLILCNPYAESNATACEKTQLCNFDPLIIGLVGGAIAGIAIACAFVALFLLSGASYAIAQQQGSAAGPVVHHSPLYVGDGTSGVNHAT